MSSDAKQAIIRCPSCKAGDMSVDDTRGVIAENVIRRRRLCPLCGHRVTTFERIGETYDRNRETGIYDERSVRRAAFRLLVDALEVIDPEAVADPAPQTDGRASECRLCGATYTHHHEGLEERIVRTDRQKG